LTVSGVILCNPMLPPVLPLTFSLASSPSPCDGPFCSPSSGSLEASERFRAEFDRIAAMVAPLSSTAVYSVLVSAFMARGAILFKLQSKVFQDMLSRGDLTYMGAVSRIADFRATVRAGWLAVPRHASLWFARVVGASFCFLCAVGAHGGWLVRYVRDSELRVRCAAIIIDVPSACNRCCLLLFFVTCCVWVGS
jgi:hypothetical protein